LSADDAKHQLVESLKSEAKNDAMVYIQDTMEEAKLTAEQDAKKIIINTIQRIGTEEAVDNCVSVLISNLMMLKEELLVVRAVILEPLKQLLVLKLLSMILQKPLYYLVLILYEERLLVYLYTN